jgi:hypothetical protein
MTRRTSDETHSTRAGSSNEHFPADAARRQLPYVKIEQIRRDKHRSFCCGGFEGSVLWYVYGNIIFTRCTKITVATRSEALTASNTGVVRSNPTTGMDTCVRLFCVCVFVLCVGRGLATG